MYNEINLIGRVGTDPEVKTAHTESGMVRFRLAVTKKKKGEAVTSWFNCQAWGNTAEIIEEYVKKGDLIHINGELEVREHEGKIFVNVNIRQVTLIHPKPKPYAEKPQEATVTNDLPF